LAVARNYILPVRIHPSAITHEFVRLEDRLVSLVADARPLARILVHPASGPALEVGELLSVEHLDVLTDSLHAVTRVVADARRACVTTIGGDQHHAVGAARPVNRRGRGVLEDLD